MRIRLSKIQIENFKTFKDLTIFTNDNFNIIIGENNSGKSTIFEAIHLWERCYQSMIQVSNSRKFYKADNEHRYLNYQALDCLRITTDNDLLYSPKTLYINITLTLCIDNESFELGFKIAKLTSVANAFLRICTKNQEQFTAFADKIAQNNFTLDGAIFIYQTHPVAGVLQFENYLNDAQVKKKMQKGLSHEVLRNKIIAKRNSIENLQSNISEILHKNVEFTLPSQDEAKTKEFISLLVSVDGSKSNDLHLQGSGFLQIVEILSTIEFSDAPLKLLLVDEPDSHIHAKLQANLINHLRGIDHNQFFIISHNDQFVRNAGANKIFYLSQQAKNDKSLKPLKPEAYDTLKEALGGILLPLENLNYAEQIVFVEGNVDINYLNALEDKIKTLMEVHGSLSSISFFTLSGRDRIEYKIENIAHVLNGITKNKVCHVIFDRDFSSNESYTKLKNRLTKIDFKAFSHEGYCFESVIFTDIDILKRYMHSLLTALEPDTINSCIDDAISKIKNGIVNVSTDFYTVAKGKFLSQKKTRSELEDIPFDAWVNSCFIKEDFKLEKIMSKQFIGLFIAELENELDETLFEHDPNMDLSTQFFYEYIEFIEKPEDIVPSIKNLFIQLGVLTKGRK